MAFLSRLCMSLHAKSDCNDFLDEKLAHVMGY